jgi:DNA-directed RNA polymerase beta' subunit
MKNIFGVIENNKLIIKDKWFDKFMNKNINSDNEFKQHNDIILDKIIEINKLDGSKYNKVYDLTVPSTLNFGLANGLHVVDTADSGYISRRLMKAMEDLMVTYDGTVRNSNNSIVQYVYGDSHVDQTRQTRQRIKIINMNNDELKKFITFTDKQIEEIVKKTKHSKSDINKLNDEYYKLTKEMRDNIRIIQRLSITDYVTLKDEYLFPVNLERIIHDTIKMYYDKDDDKYLDPLYVDDMINKLIEPTETELFTMNINERKAKNNLKYRNEMKHKYLFNIFLHEYLAPNRCLYEYKLSKYKFDLIFEEIKKEFNKSIVEPGEMVGSVGAQSIGEPSTQLTLDSLDWHDKIVYKDENNISYVKEIGKFIDDLVKDNDKVQLVDNNNQTEYLDINEMNLMVPTVDEDGKMHWKKLEAVTRHLPGNDGKLLKIKTNMGRQVTVTKSKSLLVRKDNKIIPEYGSNIKVGDRIPITINQPITDCIDYYDMSQVLPRTEYIYGSDVHKALDEQRINKFWWSKKGILFEVPFKRGDSLLDSSRKLEYTKGKIYNRCRGGVESFFEEKFKLDRVSGFFIGAYIAEGCVSSTQVKISNNNKEYLNEVQKFCDRYNMGTHIEVIENHGPNRNGTSQSLVIHAKLLVRVMIEWCGKLAPNKKIPDWCLCANNDFIIGLLDGYFCGDGTMNKRDTYINASSTSQELIIGLSNLLTRFGILSKISMSESKKQNNLGTKNILPTHTLTIRNGNVYRFVDNIRLTITVKREIIEKCYNRKWLYNYGRDDFIPGITFNKLNNVEIRRDQLKEMINDIIDDQTKELLINTINGDVYYDPIISIEEVEPSNPNNLSQAKVYDLTVADTRNFTVYSGVCVRDTFHATGTGSAALGGVGRINEVLNVAKKMKSPLMFIYLSNEFKHDKPMANKISSYIKYTTISNIIVRTDIYYDPNPTRENGHMKKDMVSNPFFIETGKRLQESGDIKDLPWLLRFTLSKENLMMSEITLLDIKTRFVSYWNETFGDVKKLKHKEKEIIPKILNAAILSNNDNDQEPILHIRFDIDNVNLNTLTDLEDIIINTFKLKGIDGVSTRGDGIMNIREVSFNETGDVIKQDQYIIETSGVNMKNIRYLNGIDHSRTITNDIIEVYSFFGIEAARNALINELEKVFTGKINYHHLSLLADFMTQTGSFTSINRHGIGKLNIDPLAKASFEMTVEQLLNASMFGDKDKMNSVSSRIMVGRSIKGGTGLCDILLDHEVLENSEYIERKDKIHRTFNELTQTEIIDDIIQKDNEEFFMPF